MLTDLQIRPIVIVRAEKILYWKKLLRVLLIIFGILSGCAQPMTYDEMTEALKTAPPEERAKLEEKVRRFERDVERAEIFFARKSMCERTNKVVWVCIDPKYDERQIERMLKSGSLDNVVRVYRGLKSSCGCVESNDLF